MSRLSNFKIVNDNPEEPLVIADVGPWNTFLSVTNDAEQVVERLVRKGSLPEGRRLLYYDSEGCLSELLVKDGKFAGFK